MGQKQGRSEQEGEYCYHTQLTVFLFRTLLEVGEIHSHLWISMAGRDDYSLAVSCSDALRRCTSFEANGGA